MTPDPVVLTGSGRFFRHFSAYVQRCNDRCRAGGTEVGRGVIMRSLMRIVLIILLAEFIGCASHRSRMVRKDRNFIYAHEIETVPQAKTVWDIIQILRPNLLQRDNRKQTGLSTVMPALVYVNDIKYGDKERLKDIPNQGIVEIKYISGTEAGAQYGSNSYGGVFLITIR